MKSLSTITIILLISNLTAPGQITGSGTAGYLPKFTSASAVGNSLIYTTGTSVGIGTTAVAKLEIEAGAGNENIRISGNIGSYERTFSSLSYGYPALSYHAYKDAVLQGTTGEIAFLDRPGTYSYVNAVRTSDILFKTAHSYNPATNILGQFLDISMAIKANQDGGYVGIGTPDPLTRLHVNGIGSFGSLVTTTSATRALNIIDANAIIKIVRVHPTSAPAIELISKASSADGPDVAYWDCYAQPGDASFRIRDKKGGAALDRLTILNATGYVGIGTIKPQELLAVNGTILAKKVRVSVLTADWPDYVFEKKYQLPALPVLERFIQENKHLPDVPSSADVAKEGIDLGEMQSKLLKKIEELTLYMIEQNKHMEKQSAEINSLKKQIALLQK